MATYTGLTFPALGVLSLGECLSMWARQQSSAALGTLLVCLFAFRIYGRGILRPADLAVCAALVLAGWLFTWRSIQALRGNL